MDNDAAALRLLAHDYWEGILRRNPTTATFYSDYRYNDRLPDVGPAGRAEEEAELRAVLARLEPLRDAQLDVDDRITWDMLSLAAHAGLDSVRLRFDEMAVDQLDGRQVWLPQLPTWHPTDTSEHVEQLVSRYRAFGSYMDQYLSNLRDGVRDARTAPTIAVERVIAQLRALLATHPDDSPMAAPATAQPPALADALRHPIAEIVDPAFQDLLDFLEGYLTHDARQDPGVWAVTDGQEIYALLARQHTTTELSPVHHLRWSRQQAIEFFVDNVGLTERETLNEVDRYIIWPGQALAYKIGQREIEALRHVQQQRLGERFDLRAFHDALLAHAAVPLSSMRLLVE